MKNASLEIADLFIHSPANRLQGVGSMLVGVIIDAACSSGMAFSSDERSRSRAGRGDGGQWQKQESSALRFASMRVLAHPAPTHAQLQAPADRNASCTPAYEWVGSTSEAAE